MNRWPFVSRSRFEELRRDHLALREAHERVLDQINFRSTGFHLYERFDQKPDPAAPAASTTRTNPLNDPPAQASEEVQTTRLRSRIQSIERTNLNEFEVRRKTVEEQLAVSRSKAAEKLEKALSEGDEMAKNA